MIQITITGKQTGKKALLYEFFGRKGRRRFMPTYASFAECLSTGKRFDFSVTRDSSTHIFGAATDDRYGERGECPPSAEIPYTGIIREDGRVGFRIQLFEAGCEKAETLTGQGKVVRKHIQIHFGAACSIGCIMVAGRRRSYRTVFERPLRAMIAHSDTIQVIVHPR